MTAQDWLVAAGRYDAVRQLKAGSLDPAKLEEAIAQGVRELQQFLASKDFPHALTLLKSADKTIPLGCIPVTGQRKLLSVAMDQEGFCKRVFMSLPLSQSPQPDVKEEASPEEVARALILSGKQTVVPYIRAQLDHLAANSVR
jgi:hypothetical protein